MATAVTVILQDEVVPHVWLFETNELAARFRDAAVGIIGVLSVEIHRGQIHDPSMVSSALAELRGLAGKVSGG